MRFSSLIRNDIASGDNYWEVLNKFKYCLISEALRIEHNNITKTAATLKVSRNHLMRLMKALGVQTPRANRYLRGPQ